MNKSYSSKNLLPETDSSWISLCSLVKKINNGSLSFLLAVSIAKLQGLSKKLMQFCISLQVLLAEILQPVLTKMLLVFSWNAVWNYAKIFRLKIL